jgi:hypothetical protein
MKTERLQNPIKISTVSRPASVAISVSAKTINTAQSANSKQTALRLLCRAMIRLYLQDHGKPDDGERLGIL